MVLSNGDPLLFDKIKSKEEAENLAAWIHHLLGVEAHEMVEEEEVKVKEIVEDILNESVDLLAEAEEEDNHEENSISLLEELCQQENEEEEEKEKEEEREDLVLADVEETVDFFQLEASQPFNSREEPSKLEEDVDLEDAVDLEVRDVLEKHYSEAFSKPVDQPEENKDVDELEEEMFKDIRYVSFDMPIVDDLSVEEEDDSEYLPGTLEITEELPNTGEMEEQMEKLEKSYDEIAERVEKLEKSRGIVAAVESTGEVESFEDLDEQICEEEEYSLCLLQDALEQDKLLEVEVERQRDAELSDLEWFSYVAETDNDSESLEEAVRQDEEVKKQEEKEKLRDELGFDLEDDIRGASLNMQPFVEDEIVKELNKVEWLQLVSRDADYVESLEEQSDVEEEEREEVVEATNEISEEEWFDLVSETDADNEKLAAIYQIEEDLFENYLIVDKFGMRDGEDIQEEEEDEEEEEEEEEAKEEDSIEKFLKENVACVQGQVKKEEEAAVEKVIVDHDLVENERKDVSLQTDFDSSDDEDDEEPLAKKKNPCVDSSDDEEPLAKLMIAEKDGEWNETIEKHVEETIESVISMHTKKMQEDEEEAMVEDAASVEDEAKVEENIEQVQSPKDEPSSDDAVDQNEKKATDEQEVVQGEAKIEPPSVDPAPKSPQQKSKSEVVLPEEEKNKATPDNLAEKNKSSEDLKCPLCEKPPFKGAELLKHLTSTHFGKQVDR